MDCASNKKGNMKTEIVGRIREQKALMDIWIPRSLNL
jgi:hypothetical protein